eukprot:sb/3467674/
MVFYRSLVLMESIITSDDHSPVRLSPGLSDVLYFKLSTLLQGYYLYHHNATLAEHYWGLSRSYLDTPSSNLPSLSCDTLAPSATKTSNRLVKLLKVLGLLDTVLTPFLNQKLAEWYSDHHHGDEMPRWREVLVRLYPYFNLGMSGINTVVRLGYYLGYTNKHSLMAGFLGLNLSFSDTTPPPLSVVGRIVELVFPVAMFYVQFLKQWSAVEVSPYEAKLKPPPPHTKPPANPGFCDICGAKFRIPTAVPITGLVYCYVCIYTHAMNSGTCPVTQLPLKTGDLIKLNVI